MTTAATVRDLTIDTRPEEVLRYLGYQREDQVSPRAAKRLATLMPAALALAEPRGAYRLVPGEQARAAGVPPATELIGVAVCTVGPRLEHESARLSAAGELLDALLFDAVGSAAAEAAADALNQLLCADARRRGLAAAARVSPGYGTWETARQRELLALLPIADLAVSLTSGAMMVPRKSVSFAVALGTAEAVESAGGAGCAYCGLLSCRHRVVSAADRGA